MKKGNMFAMREERQTRELASLSKNRHGSSDVAHQTMTNTSQSLQRYLGNSYLQSTFESRPTLSRASDQNGVPTLQRKCACGGSCASCAGKEEEIRQIQTKLTIGVADDVYEREADRVADKIMQMSASSSYDGDNFHKDIGIQRISANPNSSYTLESDLDVNLNQSGGKPLSLTTRQFMEPRFGVDFSHVRLHADSNAHQMVSQLQARAFTYGHHIWLGSGESDHDKNLIAHELTHAVQQGVGEIKRIQRYSHQNCEENDLRAHIWPADWIARNMVNKAIRVLRSTPPDPAIRPLLSRHFMSATPDIPTIHGVYQEIKNDFDDNDYQYECEYDCTNENAYVYGLWTDIHLCMNQLRGRANDCIASTIVHEFSHYSANTDDESGRCYDCGNFFGCPVGLSTSDAVDNADSYAAFAYELYPMAV